MPGRILVIHTRYRLPGGEDAVFAAECSLLEAHGWQVTRYARANAEVDGRLFRKLLLPFTALFSLRSYRDVRALIRQNHIQLVHVHNTLLVASPSVFWACFAEGVPVVQSLHNFRLFCPNGILLRDGRVCEDCPRHGLRCAVAHRCYRGSRAQSLVCAGVYALHRALKTYRRVHLIALTDFDRDKLLAYNQETAHPVFDPQKLWVKPHFVSLPPDLASAPPPLWRDRKNQVVYAARLEELKGLRTAIAAWKLLTVEMAEAADTVAAPALGSVATPATPALPMLLIAGTGPLEAWAKAEAETAGLPVRFLGQLPKPELLALLAESRAALVPSLCFESFALVPAEAHALGTPVLASDIGNVGAAVDPGVDGFRFAAGDPAALAQAVKTLVKTGAQLDPAAIRAAALAKYGPAQNYAALNHIYEMILKENHP